MAPPVPGNPALAVSLLFHASRRPEHGPEICTDISTRNKGTACDRASSHKCPEPLSEGVTMPITCCIQYTLDPRKVDAFEEYASRWPPIIGRCGGDLVGYYLPKEGANNFALALIDFPSLAAYEDYRQRLREDPEADRNFTDAQDAACILVESRTFLRRV